MVDMVDHPMRRKLRQELGVGPLSDNPKAQVEAKTCWFSVFQLSITLSTSENRKNPKQPQHVNYFEFLSPAKQF